MRIAFRRPASDSPSETFGTLSGRAPAAHMAFETIAPRPAAPHQNVPRLRHLPALDGLRGLAVIGVLCYHGGFDWASGGFLGVSTFFTLSGFLITALLLVERETTGEVSLRDFWGRRARRLLPAALAAMALATLFVAFAGSAEQVRGLRGDIAASLLYLANWHFVLESQSYGDLFSIDPSPLLHFWSLAIEEQVYVVYPLIIAALTGAAHRSREMLLGVLGLAATVSLLIQAEAGFDPDRVYFGTDTRASEFLIGGLLAVVLQNRRVTEGLRDSTSARFGVAVVGLVAFQGVALLWILSSQKAEWLYQGGFTAYALLSGTLILAAVTPDNPVRAMLGVRPLRVIGRISYGLYLYHWPVFLWVGRMTDLGPYPRFVLEIALTSALAVASYRFLEKPIRIGRRPAGVRAATLLMPASAALVFLVMLVTAAPPEPTLDLASAQASADAAEAEVEGAAGNVPRVAFAGDSTAFTTSTGVNDWILETGEAAFGGNGTQLGCGVGRGGERRMARGGENTVPDECQQWDTDWAELVRDHEPDLVFVQTGLWDVADRRIPGDDRWRRPGDPIYDDYLYDELLGATDTLASRGALVVWLTAPTIGAYDGIPPFESRGHDADPARMRRLNDLIYDVARARPKTVRVVDMAAWFAARSDADELRPDGLHVSPEGSRIVADELLIPTIEALWAERSG